jgi:tRNA(Ile)-lysidine synthase
MQAYIKAESLFLMEERILLAVSGGLDSVVLCHLMKRARLNFGIAHCNFQLRGGESVGDAQFVEQLAKDMGIEYFCNNFDTPSYAADHNISIQMAARDLRYAWLEDLRQQNGYAFIATAHHRNDSVETVIYNFAKGCGIRGLHGILPKQGKVIRPLLFATREDIEAFQKEHQLQYREDASNASDKYQRNFIRHQIIPRLKEINPNLEQSAGETINRIRETEWIFKEAVQNYRSNLVQQAGDTWRIAYKKLPPEAATTLLYELLLPFGFHGDQVNMILENVQQPGVYFYSPSHQLLVDRDVLIIREPAEQEPREWRISAEDQTLVPGQSVNINCKIIEKVPLAFPKNKNVALLDFNKLSFPLTLRNWQAGDYFQPFGMNGQHKKIKDYLTGEKLNRFEKDQTLVVESAGQICWVVGHRIDERFKVDENTQRCWQMESR